MDRNKALDKIKKCLRLATSANPNEAAAAMRQAQALMRKHGIGQDDVSMADVMECTAVAGSKRPRPSGRRSWPAPFRGPTPARCFCWWHRPLEFHW